MRNDRIRAVRESRVLDADAVSAALDRLADEIIERTRDTPNHLALVGIRTRGVPIAKRIEERIAARTGRAPDFGVLDITLYRDDLTAIGEQPVVRRTDLSFNVDNAWIVLVDDVLYTGRTVRAAITALIDFGRPRMIELLVLVDRGLRELPVHADYVGAQLETTAEQTVRVHLSEEDGGDEVLLQE